MKEGALKWGLRLLGLLLSIGPTIIALGIRGWDVKATVMPTESEIQEVQGIVQNIFGEGFSENTMTVEEPEISDSSIRATVHFNSPIGAPITIMEFSGDIYDGDVKIGEISMEENEVQVPARGTATFHLVGSYSGPAPSRPKTYWTSFVVEVYGLEISIKPPEQGPFPTDGGEHEI